MTMVANFDTDAGSGLYTVKPMMGYNTEDFIPHSYLLRITETRCRTCGVVHTSSEAFLVKTHKTLTAGSGARILRPATELSQVLPVGVTRLQPKTVPFCHLCYDQLAAPKPRPEVSDSAWAEALRKEAATNRDTAMAAALRKAREEKARRASDLSDLNNLL